MPDAERPGGGEARPRLLAVRGGTARRPPAEPGDLARRLANLERQVEAALAGAAPTGSRLDAALDRLLDRYAEARRRVAERVAAAGGVTGLALEAVYRWWWRVETHGLERVPERGRVLLVANRAGTLLPYDALMLPIALAVDHPSHRRAHAVVDEGLLRLPVVGSALEQLDLRPAVPGTVRRLLEQDEAVVAFPSPAMPFRARYRIGRLLRVGLLRAALATGAPIVPVAVIGAEEAQPVLARIGGRFGLPALPVTPTFPWLGLGGLVPLPTKWTISVGDPLEVARHYPPEAARDAAAVRRLRDQVRERLQAVVSEGLRRRRALFF
jgi:1-acyl-sn-glycerol-3-phosphate acyltransferase